MAGLPVPEGMNAHRHALSYIKRGMLDVVIYRARAASAAVFKGRLSIYYC